MRALAAGAVVLLVAGGCAHAPERASGPVPGAHVHAVHHGLDAMTTTVYAVGPDIAPGVWTTDLGCGGEATSTAAVDETTDNFLRVSSRVGEVVRIALKKGEYLQTYCGPWTREDGSRPATPDPATRAGACTILVGKTHLVGAALRVRTRPVAGPSPADGLQDRLMAVVYARTPRLWAAAGQLADYLDDPAGYYEHGRLISKVSRAVARIHAVCGR